MLAIILMNDQHDKKASTMEVYEEHEVSSKDLMTQLKFLNMLPITRKQKIDIVKKLVKEQEENRLKALETVVEVLPQSEG